MKFDERYIIGFITIFLLASGIVYLTLDNVKIRVDNDKTTFYVVNENNRWVVAGREYSSIMDGSSKLYRKVSGITVNTTVNDNLITIIRETPYKDGILIRDTYSFDGEIRDVKQFPISHKVEIYNASGKFYRYEVKDLAYDGDTYKLTNESFLSFGLNMQVDLQPDYRWAWVYKSGTLRAQYDINSDYEVFYVRLFDPPTALYLEGLQNKTSIDSFEDSTFNGWSNGTFNTDDDYPVYDAEIVDDWSSVGDKSVSLYGYIRFNFIGGSSKYYYSYIEKTITMDTQLLFDYNFVGDGVFRIHINGAYHSTYNSDYGLHPEYNVSINVTAGDIVQFRGWSAPGNNNPADGTRIDNIRYNTSIKAEIGSIINVTATGTGTMCLDIEQLPTLTGDIIISGATSPEGINGYYNSSGTENGEPAYTNGNYWLWYDGGGWVITDTKGSGDRLFFRNFLENEVDGKYGIVLPFNNSLLWQKEVSGDTRTHANAQTYASGLTLGGHTWVVPQGSQFGGTSFNTPTEGGLLWWMNEERGYSQGSTANNRNYGTWLNNNWGFTGFVNSLYWSNPASLGLSWVLSLSNGEVSQYGTTFTMRSVCISINSTGWEVEKQGEYLNGIGTGDLLIANVSESVINTTCQEDGLQYDFNLSSFTSNTFTGNKLDRFLTLNESFNISIYSDYIINNISYNITGIDTGAGFPSNLELSFDGVVLETIPLVTDLENGDVSLFNDGSSSKDVNFVVNDSLLTAGELDLFFGSTLDNNLTFNITGKQINKSCFQQDAKDERSIDTSGCNLEYTGDYYFVGDWINQGYLTDGVYSRGATKELGVYESVYYYVNYTIPNNVTSAIWRLYISGASRSYTIPSSCLTSTYFQGRINLTDYVSIFDDLRWTLQCKDSTSAWVTIATYTWGVSNWNKLGEESISWSVETGYPSDLWIEVGELTGTNDWNYTGTLSTTESAEIDNTKISDYLTTCVYEDNICSVPINVYSATDGGVTINNLELNYSLVVNPITINGTILNTYLSDKTGVVNLTFTYESDTVAGLYIGDLKVRYVGGNQTYNFKVHDGTGANSIDYDVTYYYSGWDYDLPTGIEYVDFYPPSPTAQSVGAFGQTNTIPIFNISNENYESLAADYYILNNNTSDCINLSIKQDVGWCDSSYGVIIPEISSDICWQKTLSSTGRNWSDSVDYCQNDITFGGFEWELMNRTEAVLLRNFACDNKESGPTCSSCDPYTLSTCNSVSGVNLGSNFLNGYEGFSGYTDSIFFTSDLSGASTAYYLALSNGIVGNGAISYSGAISICISHRPENLVLNESWQEIKSDQVYGTNFGLWMYADFDCDNNYYGLYSPELYFRACCDGCDVCSEELI